MSSYKYATVVQLTEDDPANKELVEGEIIIAAGKHDEDYHYTVLDEENEGFADVNCKPLGVIKAPERMGENDIVSWAADQDEAVILAREAGV